MYTYGLSIVQENANIEELERWTRVPSNLYILCQLEQVSLKLEFQSTTDRQRNIVNRQLRRKKVNAHVVHQKASNLYSD